jgi:hypothetical protein
MGLDIFFSEDIRNALLAADEASTSTARVYAAVGGDGDGGGDVPSVRPDESPTRLYLHAYLEGYRAALTTVALAFGLSPAIITGRSPSTDSGQALRPCSGQEETLEVEARTVNENLAAS